MSSDITVSMSEFHWGMQVMDTIDVGLVVLDRHYNVCLWNSFMQAYSDIQSKYIMQKNMFDVVPDLPEQWLKRQINSCFELNNRIFSNWEDRPYVFKFKNYSPISNGLEVMYQNVVIMPLRSLHGDISHVCLMIQDVSDTAKSKISLRESNQYLSEISQKDGLTGLFNRQQWENTLKEEFHAAQLSNTPCTLIMFDIDHFKSVNDNYGHTAGDEVIRETARSLLATARNSDICGRYGGEEFAVLMPHTTAEQGMILAERLRNVIEQLIVKTESADIRYTISLGVSELTSDIPTHTHWIECADSALYQSKESGRNRTSVFSK